MFHLLCLSYHSFQCFTCSASFIIVFSVSLVRPLADLLFHLLGLSCPVFFNVSLTQTLLSVLFSMFHLFGLLSSSLQCFTYSVSLVQLSSVFHLLVSLVQLSSMFQLYCCSLQCFTCSDSLVQFSSMFHLFNLSSFSSVFHLFGLSCPVLFNVSLVLFSSTFH